MGWETFKSIETETVLPALILIVDEYKELIDSSDDSENLSTKEKRDLTYKITNNIESVARLGRAAHVHVILCTQSPQPDVFPSSLKNNVKERVLCGNVSAGISRMAIDTEEGISIPPRPGACLGYASTETTHFQGWYTSLEAVLKVGTVKEGYDPKNGAKIEDDSETEEDDFVEFAAVDQDSEEKEEEQEEKEEEERPLSQEEIRNILDDPIIFETEVKKKPTIKIKQKKKVKLDL